MEVAHRHEIETPLRELFENHLEGDDQEAALLGLALLGDAAVYSLRSRAWVSLITSTKTPLGGTDPDVDRAIGRYRADATERLILRYGRLKPLIEIAKEFKKEADWRAKIAALSATSGVTDDPVACSP